MSVALHNIPFGFSIMTRCVIGIFYTILPLLGCIFGNFRILWALTAPRGSGSETGLALLFTQTVRPADDFSLMLTPLHAH